MSQTVVGMFNDLAAARSAETRLHELGFGKSMVDVSPGKRGDAAQHDSISFEDEDEDDDDGDDDDVAADHRDTDGPVKRFFKSLFGTGSDADRHVDVASQSEAIVTVHVESADQARQAADVLDSEGALAVDDATRVDRDDRASDAVPAQMTSSDDATGPVKVIEEELQVGTRTVQTGGARIRSRVVEHAVEEDVRLREERVTVHRKPVDRVASPTDLASFREGQVEVVEHAEVPVVAKEARVVEEISVDKTHADRTETIHDTVRGTDVQVDQLPGTKRTP